MTNQSEIDTEDFQPAIAGKGLLTTFGVSLYPQELDYVDRLSATYGTSRAATIRAIINRDRLADQAARAD